MPLLIGLHEKEALAAAMARAREQPLPLDVVVHRAQAIDQATNTVTLAERKAAPSPRAGVQNVALPFGYRVAISFEEQPAGMCLHLSMSSGAKGEGEPDFRCADKRKFHRALKEKRCWVCGDKLGVHLAFVIGPMCAVNKVTSEPPCHLECAEYSVRICPFLSRPRMRRNEHD